MMRSSLVEKRKALIPPICVGWKANTANWDVLSPPDLFLFCDPFDWCGGLIYTHENHLRTLLNSILVLLKNLLNSRLLEIEAQVEANLILGVSAEPNPPSTSTFLHFCFILFDNLRIGPFELHMEHSNLILHELFFADFTVFIFFIFIFLTVLVRVQLPCLCLLGLLCLLCLCLSLFADCLPKSFSAF